MNTYFRESVEEKFEDLRYSNIGFILKEFWSYNLYPMEIDELKHIVNNFKNYQFQKF